MRVRKTRGLWAFLAVVFLFDLPTFGRDLSFEERVKAQEAIERVYYSHQIGATKPFEEAVPRQVIERKVRTYLKQSVALEQLWKTKVTAEMLDREVERMAHESRMPGRLQELFTALGDDPILIPECLARATVVDRLSRSFFASDEAIHARVRDEATAVHSALLHGELAPSDDHPNRTVVQTRTAGTDDDLASRGLSSGLDRSLEVLDVTPEEFARWRGRAPREIGEIGSIEDERDALAIRILVDETANDFRVVTFSFKKQMWDEWWGKTAAHLREQDAVTVAEAGRIGSPSALLHSRGSDELRAYEPPTVGSFAGPVCAADDTWDNGSLGAAPTPRSHHTAVWTGSLMVVWGGYDGTYLNTGGRYDPLTDTWMPTSTVGAPSGRFHHSAVWSGSLMLVWGGNNGAGILNTGGRYDPLTDNWTPTSTVAAPSNRELHTAVWTGGVMIVWGGAWGSPTDTGARYDPLTNLWTPTSTVGAPSARYEHAAVWTGSVMVVWGGLAAGGAPGYLNTGGRYNPATNTWTPMSTTSAPSARHYHTLVWTGSRIVVWGGYGGAYLNTGGRYDPAADTWISTSTANAPVARWFHTAVWNGTQMVVWGGQGTSGYLNTGGSYHPQTDTWTSTSAVAAASGRYLHTSVWTGTLMVVWGGTNGSTLDSGARYDPSTGTWTPTSPGRGPSARNYHTALWTGNLMIVWGGTGPCCSSLGKDDGSRYDPALDTWAPTSTTGTPTPRFNHTAVWTGSQMIVWGGRPNWTTAALNTGALYDPLRDSWTDTSPASPPSARYYHVAAWTGSLMVVWGGNAAGGSYLNTGGRYDPADDTWSPMSMTNAPGPAAGTAVWTGTEMLVWGGEPYPPAGGRYSAATDAWTPMSTTGSPTVRREHSTVWTGQEMIIWGGYRSGTGLFGDGSRYNPVADSWTALPNAGAPTARSVHTAVWTENAMVVWSGGDASGPVNTGGRYSPLTNTWVPTSTNGAPEGRQRHTAVWTGSHMLVWGGTRGGTTDLSSGGRYALGHTVDNDGDGYTECAGDCNDGNPSIHPGAPESCNGADDDCDGLIDEGFDADGDGFKTCTGDCNDANPRIYPNAPERCDFVDNQCPGNPGFGQVDAGFDADGDGFTTCQNDCDDNNALRDPRPGHGCDSANHGRDSGSPVTSDPVNVATGNFTQEDTDLKIAGRGIDLTFSRAYNSKDPVDGPLGFGWVHSFNFILMINADGTRAARMEDGHTEIYTQDGLGGYTPPYGLRNSLVANGDGTYSLKRKSDRLRFDFDSTGRLTRIIDKNGNAVLCNYTLGLLTSLTDTVGRTVSLAYDGSNRLITLTDPIGRTVTYGYDVNGNLTSVIDVRGNTTSYTYDADHQLLTITDPRGNPSVTNVYDGANRVVSSQQDALGNGTQFVYNWTLNKTEVTDPLTNTTTFYYDNYGRTLRVVDPLGNELSYAYDSAGQRTSMTDKAGKVTQFTYDYRGNVLSRTDPDTAVTQFTYDGNDHVIKRRDPLAFEETFTYDAFGNQAAWIDRTGKTETRAYTLNGQLQTLTDRRGKSTTYAYDAQGNLLSVTDPLGKVTSHTYDGAGRRLTTTDANLKTTTFFYDPADHLIQVRNPLLQSTFHSFDPNGNPTTTTDPTAAVTTKQYDVKNRLIKVIDPLLHETNYAYDANDRRISETDPRGNVTQFGYDGAGNLTSVTDALLRTTSYSYDAAGRRLTATDPETNVTRWTYDTMGRVLTVKDALLNTATKTYDLRGDELTTIDPRGKTTMYEREGEQRLTAIVDALLGRSEFTYDEEGHRKTLKNANIHITSYTYDDAGRLIATTDPLLNVTSFSYDDGGRRISRTDASNRTTTYSYDAADRLTTILYPDSSTATFGYDAAGRRTSMVDNTGTTTFVYDAAGRVLSVTDGASRTIGYGYDNANNRTSMTLPGSLTVVYTYDVLNRLSTVTDWGTGSGTATYAYSPAGRLTEVTYPNGTSDTMTYDSAGRLTRQTTTGSTAGTITDYVITLDAAGNRIAIDRSQPLTGTLSDLDESYSYDVGERILSRGPAIYGHDPQGNMTARMDSSGTATFAYDFDNRMTGVLRGALADSYGYDADGNRTHADRAAVVTQYLLDRYAPLVSAVAEFDGSGNATRYHIHGYRLLWSLDIAGNRYAYHSDPIGSVVAVTDATQAGVAAFDYDEFGTQIANVGSFSTDATFIGELGVTSEPSHLYFMRTRYYDAAIGRFLGEDPAESVTTASTWANPYIYCFAEPINHIDPKGEFIDPVIGYLLYRGAVGALFDVASQVAAGKSIAQLDVAQTVGAFAGGVASGGVTLLTVAVIPLTGPSAPLAAGIGAFYSGYVGTLVKDVATSHMKHRPVDWADVNRKSAESGKISVLTFGIAQGLGIPPDSQLDLVPVLKEILNQGFDLLRPAAAEAASVPSSRTLGGNRRDAAISDGSNTRRFSELITSQPGVCVKCPPSRGAR